MANIEFAGFLYTDAGVAVNGATADLLDRNTTTPVRATTTTNASGYWTISHATEGRFDVRITNGSSIRWHKYDAALQLQEIETANLLVRNPANTFKYDIVPGAIVADRQLNLPVLTATDTLAVLALAQTFLTGAKTFNDNILTIRNPADTFSYSIRSSAITAARDLTLPLLTANDTLAVLALAQTFLTGAKTFNDNILTLRNPADTFSYSLRTSAITAARDLTVPLLTANDTLAVLAEAQTFLTGVKTFRSSILAIRNPADTFSYTVVGSAITAARNLTVPLITADDTLAVLGLAQTWTALQSFGTNLGGTLQTAAQPNVTSLGTLTALTVSGTLSMTNASPFSMTNGQVLTVAQTAQTVGAATLTVPNFAGVADTFAFLTLAQTLANKTLTSPVVNTQLTGTAVGTGASQVAQGSHTTPAATATVAGHVPTPPNNTTTFLRGDMTFAAPGAGALTRAGGNSTEATWTGITDGDRLSITVTAIVAANPFGLDANIRKTTGAAANVGLGLKLNATVVMDGGAVSASTNRADSGLVRLNFGARVTDYLAAITHFVSMAPTAGAGPTVTTVFNNIAASFPTADITTVVLRGNVSDALITGGLDEGQVYAKTSS